MNEEHPERRRWDGDRENLAYEVGDDIEDGERAVLQWVDDSGEPHAEAVEIGTFESHNSWLSMFGEDGSGEMYFARPDGVLLYETFPEEEVTEIGEVKRVVRAEEVEAEHVGFLRDLSIAPGSGEPNATREKELTWAVAADDHRVALALSALDAGDEMYTAIAKGYFSREEAERLRDKLNEVLADE